jgi:hypothetical protein
MNSLILAAQNGAKNVIIPFIGGGIFLSELQKKLGSQYSLAEHAKILVKGVTKYFEFISTPDAAKLNINDKSLESILFCPFNTSKVDEKTPMDNAIREKNSVFGKCKVTASNGSMNIIKVTIEQCKNGMKDIAIVNAANVELEFGSGISSMCYAAINKDALKQNELQNIRKQFVIAYKNYIIRTKASAAASPPATSPPAASPPASPLAPPASPPASRLVSSSPRRELLRSRRASPPLQPKLVVNDAEAAIVEKLVIPSSLPAKSVEKSKLSPNDIETLFTKTTNINATKRASIKDFYDAQDKIITKLQSGKNEQMTQFKAAYTELFVNGRKTSDWIWFIIPSDINTSTASFNSFFYGIGPNSTALASRMGLKGESMPITPNQYASVPVLWHRYIVILHSITLHFRSEIRSIIGDRTGDRTGDRIGDGIDETKKRKIKNVLIGIIGKDIDYYKLVSSLQIFYEQLTKESRTNFYINFLLNIMSLIEPDKFVSGPSKDVILPSPAPVVPRVTTGGARIVTLDQIKRMIVDGSRSTPKSIFLINGGSFNPPHIGHIKTFELAYQRLMQMGKFKDQLVYGIMVVATRSHIAGKNVPQNAIISSSDRIELCKLAANSYGWASASFNQKNMLASMLILT